MRQPYSFASALIRARVIHEKTRENCDRAWKRGYSAKADSGAPSFGGRVGGSAQDPEKFSHESRKIPRFERSAISHQRSAVSHRFDRKPSRATARQHSQFCRSIARIDAPVPQSFVNILIVDQVTVAKGKNWHETAPTPWREADGGCNSSAGPIPMPNPPPSIICEYWQVVEAFCSRGILVSVTNCLQLCADAMRINSAIGQPERRLHQNLHLYTDDHVRNGHNRRPV
eukprot:scaffold18979_cov40-Cyclotella_meneghiniana.AAC.1